MLGLSPNGKFRQQLIKSDNALSHILNADAFVVSMHTRKLRWRKDKGRITIAGDAQVPEKVRVGKATGNRRYQLCSVLFARHFFYGAEKRGIRATGCWTNLILIQVMLVMKLSKG